MVFVLMSADTSITISEVYNIGLYNMVLFLFFKWGPPGGCVVRALEFGAEGPEVDPYHSTKVVHARFSTRPVSGITRAL